MNRHGPGSPKLDVYRHAVALLKICDEIIQHLPKGRGEVKKQLESAATSVVANVAEGAGEFSGNEKARFYRMARRSATEIAAWVDIIAARREPLIQRARHELEIVVPMLVKLVRTCER